MKNTLRLILFLLLGYQASIAQSKGFELRGNIEGIKDGTPIYLITRLNDTLSKAIIKGNKFTFAGYIEGEADYYFIGFDTVTREQNYSNPLWLVNSDLKLSGSRSTFTELKLLGSEPHTVWEEFRNLQKINFKKPEWKNMHFDFVKSHLNSLFTPYIITDLFMDIDMMDTLFQNLNDSIKSSFWGMDLAKRIKQYRITAKANIDGKIPDFNITTVNGEKKSIYNIAAESKYTLVDFWASWCAPCIAAIPKLSKVFEEFHSKGLNIIGISTDKSESAWKTALNKNKTPWAHGIDNLDNAAKNVFGIVGIPSYILIDQAGNIIQSDILSSQSQTKVQIKRYKDKSLFNDVYKIVQMLLNEEKNKQ